jgi:hypothetical protein
MHDQPPALTPELASRLARIALDNITREHPYSPDHVLIDTDARRPRELHPAFYGSFALYMLGYRPQAEAR